MSKKHNKKFSTIPPNNNYSATTQALLGAGNSLSKVVPMNIEPSNQPYKRCYESHPPLKIGDYEIYGGSCINPYVKDADIYIGFDMSMDKPPQYPWNGKIKEHVYFHITDMSIPKDVVEFKKMLDWIQMQLIAGKKIHMGCIGGHGRTGTVMAALVQRMLNIEDAITYVRNGYCKKVVESEQQIDFLHQHFGITKVEASKDGHFFSGHKINEHSRHRNSWADNKTTSLFNQSPSNSSHKSHSSYMPPSTPKYTSERVNAGVHKELHDIQPVLVLGNIWG